MARLLYGLQPVREAIRAHGSSIERILLLADGSPTLDAVARFARDHGIPVDLVSRAELDRRTAGGRHQGVVALAPELRVLEARDLEIGPATLMVVLDGVMDPQNFGAVIRSGVALGATAIVWPEHASAPLSPATFRASAGAIEYARLCRVASLPDALTTFNQRGVKAIALDAQGELALHELDLTGPTAIVIGAEDKGIRRPVRSACAHTAKLPMRGPIGSLNASVASAIALYEVARQRSAIGR
jgi:23S rRNA (guanosine2251-2'-O)-methyltransferase